VGVTRIVANLPVSDVAAANAFYADVLGLSIGMDQGWVGTVVAESPSVQLSVVTRDATAPVDAAVSVGVTDVDAVYERVVTAGGEIVHPVTDEPWAVRRFFFRDPDGNIVNVVAHR
jgi:predicted enzyme related to lactoylglutathione lyase